MNVVFIALVECFFSMLYACFIASAYPLGHLRKHSPKSYLAVRFRADFFVYPFFTHISLKTRLVKLSSFPIIMTTIIL